MVRCLLRHSWVACLALAPACTTVPSATGGGGSASAETASGAQTATGASGASTSSTGLECSESPCKLTTPQCGCDDEHQCSVVRTGIRLCIAKGAAPVGAACDAMLCEPGTMCFDDGVPAHCAKFCASSADCVAPGGACFWTLKDGMGGIVPDATLCTEDCDPTTNAGCDLLSGGSCQAFHDLRSDQSLTACVEGGPGTPGASCPNGAMDCAPTLGCFNNGTSDVCLKWCVVGGTPCLSGSCYSFSAPLVIGAVEYGACN